MIYLLLFYEYFKTGLFAVGGGMATLPFIYDMSARHPDWFTTSQILSLIHIYRALAAVIFSVKR